MKCYTLLLLCCGSVVAAVAEDTYQLMGFEQTDEDFDSEAARERRDVIEEEKYYNIREQKTSSAPPPWVPGALPPDDPTTRVSLTNDDQVLPLYHTTEKPDKPTGRGARASNENWIKLPFPGRDEVERDSLTPPQPSGDLLSSRMPRVNFVTQNKPLDTSESRNDKEIVQRSSRNDELRTEFVRPGEDPKTVKPVYPRQAVYYPDESRRYYDDRYVPPEEYYRRDPYYDMYDRRRLSTVNYFPSGYGPRVDRFDEPYDSYASRKPKRIIYYAHLPEVVRTPPSVDLRYRYSVDPYRRFDDDYHPGLPVTRAGRYDYRFRPSRYPYPYAPLRKEERIYRDLAGAGSTAKDKKVEEKVTAAPVLPQKDDKLRSNVNSNRNNRNMINSHQYHDGVAVHYNDPASHKSFQDVVRPDDSYLRFEEPLFHSAVDTSYRQKY
ncbi:uncharacterized protein LOC119693239 [Plutella xylostella]|uniref:uncharacterized protein LOC119693239 n=1 Tax=Plutella xylostella TaxID=51655 RepID=UPI002032B89B|nr:uncharacterized protein LOC119693239 [Plutella xylostella]